MHAIYAIIGEHKTQPDQLLIMDADGQYYAWTLSTDETRPIQPDHQWRWDATPTGGPEFGYLLTPASGGESGAR